MEGLLPDLEAYNCRKYEAQKAEKPKSDEKPSTSSNPPQPSKQKKKKSIGKKKEEIALGGEALWK